MTVIDVAPASAETVGRALCLWPGCGHDAELMLVGQRSSGRVVVEDYCCEHIGPRARERLLEDNDAPLGVQRLWEDRFQ